MLKLIKNLSLFSACIVGFFTVGASGVESENLILKWENNMLTIQGDHLPGQEMKIHYLEAYCADGGSILISSHVLDMLERLCSRVVIIAAGKVRKDLKRDALDLELERVGTLTDLYLETTTPYRV